MKIGPSDPYAAARTAQTGRASARASAAGQASAAATAPASDSVTLAGVPLETVTPQAREALLGLMGQVDRLRQEASALRERVRELEALADRDALTPTLNRRAFVRELSRMMSFAERYGVEPGLVYVDLNDFKGVNDTYGHAAGDAVLVHVATFLIDSVRDTDVVGRLGGDEFAVALAAGGNAAAELKAGNLRDWLANKPIDVGGATLTISASFGAVQIAPGESADEAIDRADRAMYAAKQAARATR